MWPGLQKQGTWAHKIWLLFQTFMTHNFSFYSIMAMKFCTLIKYLMGFIVHVTEQKYSFAVLRNYLLCDGQDVVCAHMPFFHRPSPKIMMCVKFLFHVV